MLVQPRKSTSVKLLVTFLLSILLAGCKTTFHESFSLTSKDSESSQSKTAASKNEAEETVRGFVVPSYFFSYELTGLDDCSTGKKEIVASSEEALDKAVCEMLLNNEENKFCAESRRLDEFLARCKGREWNPIGVATHEVASAQEKNLESESARELLSKVPENLLRKLQITNSVEKEALDYLSQVKEKLISCAIDPEKVKNCLASEGALDPIYLSWPQRSEVAVVIPFAKGQSYFVYRVSSDKKASVTVYQANYPKGSRSFLEFLSHENSVFPVLFAERI